MRPLPVREAQLAIELAFTRFMLTSDPLWGRVRP